MVDTKQTGDVKNSTGNGEAKELIRMTHGHELKGGLLKGMGATGQREAKGKSQDKYNSIMNKIYFKNVNIEMLICI